MPEFLDQNGNPFRSGFYLDTKLNSIIYTKGVDEKGFLTLEEPPASIMLSPRNPLAFLRSREFQHIENPKEYAQQHQKFKQFILERISLLEKEAVA